MQKHRWTLIETLVVVAIITIFIGMLIPALQSCNNQQPPGTPIFKAGDIVELVLDKRKAMVLRTDTRNPNTLRKQVEIRVVGSEKTMFVEPCEIKIKD